MKRSSLKAVSSVFEVVLFGLALFLVIPPIMSDGGELPVHRVVIQALAAFLVSRILSWVARDRHFLLPALEFLVFAAFSIGLMMRFRYH